MKLLKRFKMKTTPPDLKSFIGKKVLIPGVIEPVVIEYICGNLGLSLGSDKPRPQFYEINGEHLIGMLRFHAQMTGAKDITEEQFKAFEEMEFHAEKIPQSEKATVQ
jgi:hypothetical protein